MHPTPTGGGAIALTARIGYATGRVYICIDGRVVRSGSPEAWMPENVGALLYLCGYEITVKVCFHSSHVSLSYQINCHVQTLAVSVYKGRRRLAVD